MVIMTIGSAPYVPLVTRYDDALKGSRVGVYMLGLWSIPFCDMTTEFGVGSVNLSSVISSEASLTPSCAILGIAT
jgi:hypothetical protein